MSKLSKTSLSIRKKWQQEAIKRGGNDAKIIISQSQAIPVVFDLLRDSFCPMNITCIYETLKAVIPPPLLKSCLDAMSMVNQEEHGSKRNGIKDSVDSSDEDDMFLKTKSKSKKKKKNETSSQESSSKTFSSHHENSVHVKMGRNGNTTLYYLNQFVLDNEGGGLDHSDYQTLVAGAQKASAELKVLENKCKDMRQESTKIMSEPKNEELVALLRDKGEESNVIKDKLTNAEKFKENAVRRKQIVRVKNKMISQWSQRKRKCIEFLEMMEDNTEGVISKKKCLQGKGQIEIESDEVVVQQATDFHNRIKRRDSANLKSKHGSMSFVGVLLGPKATVIRK